MEKHDDYYDQFSSVSKDLVTAGRRITLHKSCKKKRIVMGLK